MFGILLIDKPQGITSHGVISRLRKILNTRRIGHAGTLDPLATGLLVVAVGPATRFLQYLDLEPKRYYAVVKFGETTNTYDAEGEITQTRTVPSNLRLLIEEALPQFLGEIQQVPPTFSAIKQGGQPAYVKARAGEVVELKPRTVFIKEFKPIAYDSAKASFGITCSGGTYIRSLAHDLGEAIGCGAHISELRRIGVGNYVVDQAITLDQVDQSCLIPLKSALTHLPQLTLNLGQIEHIRHGRSIILKEPIYHPIAALLTPDGNVVGIGNVLKEATVHPVCVIPAEVFNQLILSQ